VIDSDQNFGRVTVLVGAIRGLLNDRKRRLLDRALGIPSMMTRVVV